jgi:hypothetical protein
MMQNISDREKLLNTVKEKGFEFDERVLVAGYGSMYGCA